MTNRILIIACGDRRPHEQDKANEKIGMFSLQSNGFSLAPGKLDVPIFLSSGLLVFKDGAARNKSPNQTLAEKSFYRGNWPRPSVRSKQTLKAITIEAGHFTADGVAGTTKKGPVCNMIKTAYGFGCSVLPIPSQKPGTA